MSFYSFSYIKPGCFPMKSLAHVCGAHEKKVRKSLSENLVVKVNPQVKSFIYNNPPHINQDILTSCRTLGELIHVKNAGRQVVSQIKSSSNFPDCTVTFHMICHKKIHPKNYQKQIFNQSYTDIGHNFSACKNQPESKI